MTRGRDSPGNGIQASILTSAMFHFSSVDALLLLLNACSRVQHELCFLVNVQRQLIHFLYRPVQAVHRPQAHRRDAVRTFFKGETRNVHKRDEKQVLIFGGWKNVRTMGRETTDEPKSRLMSAAPSRFGCTAYTCHRNVMRVWVSSGKLPHHRNYAVCCHAWPRVAPKTKRSPTAVASRRENPSQR